MFFIENLFLGLGLAMDAFSVSLANGLNENKMKAPKMILVSGVFAFFQALMPMLGWISVKLLAEVFSVLEKFIPWIALILLLFIGFKMFIDGIKNKEETEDKKAVGFLGLLLQGIATSIDALSVGFTIAKYDLLEALGAATIIAAITFIICLLWVISIPLWKPFMLSKKMNSGKRQPSSG